MKTIKNIAIAVVLLSAFFDFSNTTIHRQSDPPLTYTQIKNLLVSQAYDETISAEIRRRGVNFCVDKKTKEELLSLKAGPRTVYALDIANNCLSGLQKFDFETIRINEKGTAIDRRKREVHYFSEDLGDGIKLDMVEIPSGAFLMGSSQEAISQIKKEYERCGDVKTSDSWSKWEAPQHRVTVDRFFIGRYEITKAQWEVVMNGNSSDKPELSLPMANVSWFDAMKFCEILTLKTGKSYRLPTEAEWEYACRAGTTTTFAFGEAITPEIVNYSGASPMPVGSFRVANNFGLLDMHGNVHEWCLDAGHYNYNGAPNDGGEWLHGADTDVRIRRGGSYGGCATYSRSAFRMVDDPNIKAEYIGLRVVCTAKAAQPSTESVLNTKSNITITSPIAREFVLRDIKVRGIHNNVSKNEEMWLYVFPIDDGKYYLTEIRNPSNDGVWEIKNAIIGAEDDKHGEPFLMGVLIVTSRISEEIKNNQHGLVHGFKALPSGKTFSQITVYSHRR